MSADSSHKKDLPEVAPKNLTSYPVSLTPTVTVELNWEVPETSNVAFKSTAVAFNSISSVALISKIAFDGAPIFCEASLNWITFVPLKSIPVSATWVSNTS